MDPLLKTWISTKPDVATIEYHTSFPYAGDPFYQANIGEQVDRLQYYGVNRTPTIRFDGPHSATSSGHAAWEAAYDQRKAMGSRVDLQLAGVFDPAMQGGTISATIVPEMGLTGDWRLRMAVVQGAIDYQAPNGIDEHDHVFRRFLPDPAGTPVDLGTAGSMIQVPQTFAVDPAWQALEFTIVAWLQNDTTREIEQGAMLHVHELTPLEAATWGGVKALFRD